LNKISVSDYVRPPSSHELPSPIEVDLLAQNGINVQHDRYFHEDVVKALRVGFEAASLATNATYDDGYDDGYEVGRGDSASYDDGYDVGYKEGLKKAPRTE
jgi:hypothetical protein